MKVIITVGPSANSKTTWAKDYVSKNPDWVRINRDDLRQMLQSKTQLDNRLEKALTQMQYKLIREALRAKQNVIVDNTHLRVEYLEALVRLCKGHEIEFRIFDLPIEEAIKRDALRPNPVGRTIIEKQYKDYHKLLANFDFSLRKAEPVTRVNTDNLPLAYIVDIDGTLATMKTRTPYEWHRVDEDDCIEEVKEQVNLLYNAGYNILITSGRDAVCRELTENWLRKNKINYHQLFMRKENDQRKDSIVKTEIYKTHIEPFYYVKGVFDDRLQVLETWHELGLFTFNINQQNIDF